MRKAVFSDYDGTLFTSEEDMVKNLGAIKRFRSKGNLFCVDTGRSYKDLRIVLDRYDIPFDYIILNHGGVIMNDKEEVIEFYLIDIKVGNEILEFANQIEGVSNVMFFDLLKNDLPVGSNNLTKILIEVNSCNVARWLSEAINKKWNNEVKSFVVITSEECVIEIVSAKTDKGKAIDVVLERENIVADDVYAIGDGETDTLMMEKYHGYGMVKSDDAVYKATNKLCHNVAELLDEIIEENF